MKSTIATLLMIFLIVAAYPQKIGEYRVVRVVGIVEDEVSKKRLKTDDLIPTNRKLKFASKDAQITLISPEAGIQKISGVPENKSYELLDLLKSFVRPEQKPTGSRSGAIEYLEHLQASLGFDTLLVLSPGFYPIDTDKVSLTSPAAIKAWYYLNKKVVYHKVSDGSGFWLDQKRIFGDTPPPRPLPRVIVEYYEDEKLDPILAPGILIASFHPFYTDEIAMVDEIKALVRSLPSSASASQRFELIRDYVWGEYAPTQEANLKQWLASKGIASQ